MVARVEDRDDFDMRLSMPLPGEKPTQMEIESEGEDWAALYAQVSGGAPLTGGSSDE
jgi:hypothetical protein